MTCHKNYRRQQIRSKVLRVIFEISNEFYCFKLSNEREIVDLAHPVGRMLFNSMDAFFSYGLLLGERVYWRFVREFLPKTQQELLRAEWGDVDNRRLSIAWLKDAFNKSTLHFQMLSFRNNRNVISRFYHRNACMCNGGMLEAVTEMIGSLTNVQFAFYVSYQTLISLLVDFYRTPFKSSCCIVTTYSVYICSEVMIFWSVIFGKLLSDLSGRIAALASYIGTPRVTVKARYALNRFQQCLMKSNVWRIPHGLINTKIFILYTDES
ncbi:unnamed protein product [Angiostrongylus costaricensis]|uniref:RUN domain-containing protein n=1 Tax=Angiostrongylus costaricensis TaxID=334426 RepID=A0A0R3PWU7_ANGCS|nr:unnamed protein product [Angiostrongylus costaricensis]